MAPSRAGALGVGIAGGLKEEKPTIRSPTDADDCLRIGGGGGVEVVPIGPLLRLQ